MSIMNPDPNMPIESLIDSPNNYVQPLSMDMLDELSWPHQFMTPDISELPPQYMPMQPYPISPLSPGSMPMSNHAQNIPSQVQRQRQPPSLSPRSSLSQASESPVSPQQGFATVLQHPRKQDRERRKAQNRASQRAYRERKEVQLRDLAVSLKEIETAMAEAKQENEALEARLTSMRAELEVLKNENETLRKVEVGQESVLLRERGKMTKAEGLKMQGALTPPQTDEGYDEGSRSNTASLIGTPDDMEFATEGFIWDGALLDSKEVPAVDPDFGQAETFWYLR